MAQTWKDPWIWSQRPRLESWLFLISYLTLGKSLSPSQSQLPHLSDIGIPSFKDS